MRHRQFATMWLKSLPLSSSYALTYFPSHNITLHINISSQTKPKPYIKTHRPTCRHHPNPRQNSHPTPPLGQRMAVLQPQQRQTV
ncbi:hypothetical protein BKA61DRAFT_597184 [Leptodontidium sp. MPI-SDFR-AT-0119]|nr:hypothetical protein BKA61DRAFT_597184 [Leptodontidium sp. MPI-SDFR-AT-0119]